MCTKQPLHQAELPAGESTILDQNLPGTTTAYFHGKCVRMYGAFFLSKFNLLVVSTYEIRLPNSVLLLLNLDIRFLTSTFVLILTVVF